MDEMYITPRSARKNAINQYQADITFFINLTDDREESILQKDKLLDMLDTMQEINVYDVTDDGEDWCINCIVKVSCDSIKKADKKIRELLGGTNRFWDYHYIKGVDTDEYWQP